VSETARSWLQLTISIAAVISLAHIPAQAPTKASQSLTPENPPTERKGLIAVIGSEHKTGLPFELRQVRSPTFKLLVGMTNHVSSISSLKAMLRDHVLGCLVET
jgi:hypothetical protein